MNKCPECQSLTDNEHRSCAGAEAEERAQNVNLAVKGTNHLLSCGCCDACRQKCFESWQELNAAEAQDQL